MTNTKTKTTTETPVAKAYATKSKRKMIFIREPIKTFEPGLQRYSIEVPTFETDLDDGPYDAVVYRTQTELEGVSISIYQRAKARLWVREGHFVPYTVANVCNELVALDPHDWALEGFELLVGNTIQLSLGS